MVEKWQTVERPGYFGKNKDSLKREWDQTYGPEGWRLAWETREGAVWDYGDVFWRVYVPGYAHYFHHHQNEARFITARFSYGYDKELVSKEEAFDPYALYGKEGHVNQFHHVAFNVALEYFLGIPFRGKDPLQVREGKPFTPVSFWPKGWQWSPGRIPVTRPDLIPKVELAERKMWRWGRGSIEDFYQRAKVLQVKSSGAGLLTDNMVGGKG